MGLGRALHHQKTQSSHQVQSTITERLGEVKLLVGAGLARIVASPTEWPLEEVRGVLDFLSSFQEATVLTQAPLNAKAEEDHQVFGKLNDFLSIANYCDSALASFDADVAQYDFEKVAEILGGVKKFAKLVISEDDMKDFAGDPTHVAKILETFGGHQKVMQQHKAIETLRSSANATLSKEFKLWETAAKSKNDSAAGLQKAFESKVHILGDDRLQMQFDFLVAFSELASSTAALGSAWSSCTTLDMSKMSDTWICLVSPVRLGTKGLKARLERGQLETLFEACDDHPLHIDFLLGTCEAASMTSTLVELSEKTWRWCMTVGRTIWGSWSSWSSHGVRHGRHGSPKTTSPPMSRARRSL